MITRLQRIGRPFLGTALAVVTILLSTSISYAYSSGTYGSGTYGSCEYGSACSITLTSNGTVSLNVTPSASGKCTVSSDTATVETDDSNGYTLTLASSGTTTTLTKGGSTITATSGSFASPAALTANAWGYRVDAVGSFGAGPTSSASSAAPSSTLFAALKASNVTADTIATTSSPANPAVTTTVWYGACVNTAIPSGTYTAQVTYTAVVN